MPPTPPGWGSCSPSLRAEIYTHYLEFFCTGDLSVVPHLLIYAFIRIRCDSKVLAVYLGYYPGLPYFAAQLASSLATGCSPRGSCVSDTASLLSGSSSPFPARLTIRHLSQEPGSFHWRRCSGSGAGGGVSPCSWGVVSVRSSSQLAEDLKGSMCVN